MGSQGALAAAHAAPEGDGAISAWASPASRNGVLIRAPNGHGRMPGLIEGSPSPSDHHPFLEEEEEEPLTPQATVLLCFDSRESGLQPPFFLDDDSGTTSHRDSSSSSGLLADDGTARERPQLAIATHAGCRPLAHTFYLSPSASGTSVTSGSWSSCDLSSDGSDDTQNTIMPGPTIDSPTDQLAGGVTDYFAPPSSASLPSSAAAPSTSARGPAEAAKNNNNSSSSSSNNNNTPAAECPPPSSGSGRSERTGNPLVFARWARRQHHQHQHQHQQHHSHSTSQQNGQDAHRCKGERKLSSRGSSPKRSGRRPRSSSTGTQKRQGQAGAVAQMTLEEFEALPLAIQRKVCTRLSFFLFYFFLFSFFLIFHFFEVGVHHHHHHPRIARQEKHGTVSPRSPPAAAAASSSFACVRGPREVCFCCPLQAWRSSKLPGALCCLRDRPAGVLVPAPELHIHTGPAANGKPDLQIARSGRCHLLASAPLLSLLRARPVSRR